MAINLRDRKTIEPGLLVDIRNGKEEETLLRGLVKRVISKSDSKKGVKVELVSGEIGYIEHIPTKDELRLENFKFYNRFFFLPKIYSVWDSDKGHYLIIPHVNQLNGQRELSAVLFETHEQAKELIKGTKYDTKNYPIRAINRRKHIFENFLNLDIQYFRINAERKVSFHKLMEWEQALKRS